jgi:acetylglutamate kinase
MADVPGVLDGDKQRIAQLSLEQARALVASGVAGGGMAAKLDACAMALGGGVSRVRIGDLAALTVPDAGTAIVARA